MWHQFQGAAWSCYPQSLHVCGLGGGAMAVLPRGLGLAAGVPLGIGAVLFLGRSPMAPEPGDREPLPGMLQLGWNRATKFGPRYTQSGKNHRKTVKNTDTFWLILVYLGCWNVEQLFNTWTATLDEAMIQSIQWLCAMKHQWQKSNCEDKFLQAEAEQTKLHLTNISCKTISRWPNCCRSSDHSISAADHETTRKHVVGPEATVGCSTLDVQFWLLKGAWKNHASKVLDFCSSNLSPTGRISNRCQSSAARPWWRWGVSSFCDD